MSTKKTSVYTKDTRPTIGVILDSMISGYQVTLWRGIKAAAQKYDVNLLCFLGREINSAYDNLRFANAIYKFIHENNVDGLIFITGTISYRITKAELESFFQQFQPIPMVSIAEEVNEIPSILLDNTSGIHDMVDHLVQEHHYQKIGFVCMPEGYAEGEIRFEAYKTALEKHQLPFDENLVVPGEYYNFPDRIAELLYEERQVKPEVIFVSDDYVAIPLVESFQSRGISVPEDVAVVGFDDVEEARYIDPPLTTLRQPLSEQALKAVEIILSNLAGETVPQITELSPTLVTRQSCGCLPINIPSVASVPAFDEPLADSLSDFKPELLNNLSEIGNFTEEETLQKFIDLYIQSVEHSTSGSFPTPFSRILKESEKRGEDILEWQNIISAIRPFVHNILKSKPELAEAENLLQQSRVMIAEAARRIQAYRRLKIQEQNQSFQALGQALNTIMDFDAFMDLIDQGLPGLGIPEFSIALYEQNDPDAENIRLVLGRTNEGRQELPQGGRWLPAKDFLPAKYLKKETRSSKVIRPLYFQDEQFGFVVIEDQALEESLYEALGDQISSSLKGLSLIRQVERRAVQLQTASEVSQAASSILEPEDLLQQAVNLVKDRFNLYYVGIFLADEEQKWAELRAGTGEPGKKMLDANWRLEIGGSSMIGRCVATGNPDIQLDIDLAPVHLRNPHLPETKSELALPMRSRGTVLGALTIQSEVANAFSAEDITVLQTMADQLANAIGNATLYDALAREQYLMEALMDNMPEAIYFKDRDSRFVRISRYLIDNFGVKDASEVIGKADFDFFTSEHAQPAFDDEQRIIQTGEPLLNIEELETWEDRASTWGLTSKLPLKNEDGEIIGTFGITRDITELKQIQLAQEQQSNLLQTTIEVSRAISEILDPQELSQKIVSLIKERFDFYYVGFFTVNQYGDLAILRSGTGEAGEKMLAENWQIPIDSDSMIGKCIQTGEADIQLDIDKAPAHLQNPYLPETKSEMALPLFSRGLVIGALTIQSDQPEAFTVEDSTVLQTMANQISVALSNARLFEETQTALMETETLLNVSRLASSSVGIDFALPQILDLLLKATQIDAGLFSLVNPETGELELSSYQLPEPLAEGLKSKGFSGTLCDMVYQQREPIILNDLETDSPINVEGLLKLGFQSYQGVPIETHNQNYGTLCTFSKFKLRPEDSRMNLLQAIGQQIGVAVENSRLLEQTQAALRQTGDLFAGSERIIRADSIQSILEALVETTRLQNMDRVGLMLFDQPWDAHSTPRTISVAANWTQPDVEERAPVGTTFMLEEYPLTRVIGSREPVFIKDIQKDEQIDPNSRGYLTQKLGVRSAIMLPLVIGNQSLGGIVALSTQEIRLYETEVRQTTTLSEQAASVIQSFLLNEKTQTTLAELEATQRRYQIQSWSSYNQSRQNSGLQKTKDGYKSLNKQPITEVKTALDKQVPIIHENGEGLTLTVPIMLRDQPIGAIGLQADENKRQWSPEEVALVQEITEQFALAAESLRLLDETQRRAARERLVGEITTKLRATNDPQAMLETAAAELRTALKAKRTQVLLQPNPTTETTPQPDENERGEE